MSTITNLSESAERQKIIWDQETPVGMTVAMDIYRKIEALHELALRTGETYAKHLTSGVHSFYLKTR